MRSGSQWLHETSTTASASLPRKNGERVVARLRECHEWPRRRAAEKRDELTSLHRCHHSITSSARASSLSAAKRSAAVGNS